MRYQEIAWDFDGTLYCSYPHIVASMRKAVAGFGVRVSADEVFRQVKVTVGHALRHYAPMCGCTPAQLKEWYHVYERGLSDLVQPFDGIPELLRAVCAAGGRNHICSNRSEEGCRAYLERDGLAPYFDGYACPDLGLPVKPAPDLVQYLLRTRSVAPENFLMVGDRGLDLDAAHAAGTAACFFDPDGGSREVPPTEYTAPDVAALSRVIFGAEIAEKP